MKQLYLLLLLNLTSLSLFAQQTTMPAICKNPPEGYSLGGSFTVSLQFACLDFTDNKATFFALNPLSPSGDKLSNLGYIFNFKDGDNLILPISLQTSTTVSEPGTYWILQYGNEKGNAYITCKSVEVIKTEQPDFDLIVCGENSVTVTFLDTPKNKTHGRYSIVWGDGIQNVSPVNISLPYSMTHTYPSVPIIHPYIVTEYTRGSTNFTVCQSSPIEFNYQNTLTPKITKFETNNSVSQIKMEHLGMKSYKLLAQKKGETSWSLVGDTDGFTNTFMGLDLSKIYYFKLSRKDDICQRAIESDTVSNINLAFEYPNKISWNSIDDISSLKEKIEYRLQRYYPNVSPTIKTLDFKQTNYLFSENEFEGFYNNSFRIAVKTSNVEILSNIFTLPPLSIENDTYNSVSIYPNPIEEIIQFNSIFQLKTAEIVDLQGKVVENQAIEENHISVKNLPKGKYILRLYNQEKKLIVNKTIVKM
ncbi:hypothetical protein EMA8858_00192 [Emticicia aquatica]|uniref:Secretion system C-terminal sorting domain-containing protein n=1 Tax=Emticicia aquatica TaxID=1681835 RepID=A0ABM9AK57_9BACT|nr:T9SS type A sorting domain-containing protein [Emticicia aquatica]CAH0994085.1 hypothetical protein EMA8858_00192 [Emticicia aquatica]